jgi:peptidoglycan/LPS O-acetylase OafA/YrhL
VVTAVRLLPGANALEILLLVLPVSLLVASGFHRLIELPSLAVSRRLGELERRPSQFWLTTPVSDEASTPRVGQRS